MTTIAGRRRHDRRLHRRRPAPGARRRGDAADGGRRSPTTRPRCSSASPKAAATRAFPDGFVAGGSVAGLLRVPEPRPRRRAQPARPDGRGDQPAALNAQQALGLDLGQPPRQRRAAALRRRGRGRAVVEQRQAAGVPVASYVNGAGVRVLERLASPSSTASELQPSDYELVADPALPAGSYQLTRLSDGMRADRRQRRRRRRLPHRHRRAGAGRARPLPAAAGVARPPRTISRVLDDPKGIAAASPVSGHVRRRQHRHRRRVASLRRDERVAQPEPHGDASPSPTTAAATATAWSTRPASLPTVNGTGTWIAGQPIALNGFDAEPRPACRAAATPSTVAEDRLSGRRQRQRQRPARPARRRPSSASADRWPACVTRPGATSPTPTPRRSATIGVRVQSASSSADQSAAIAADAKTAQCRRVGRQPRRGSGAPDPVPAELPGRGQGAAGRAVGVRHAAAARRVEPARPPGHRHAHQHRQRLRRRHRHPVQPPGRADRRCRTQLTSGKRVSARQRRPGRRRARRARAGRHRLRSDTSQRAVDASQHRDGADRERAGRRRRRCCSRRASCMVAAGNAQLQRRRARRRIADAAAGDLRDAAASPSPTAATAPARYLFGGQGATQKPFVDAPAACSSSPRPRPDAAPSTTTGLPLTTDGSARLAGGAHRQRRLRDQRRRRRARTRPIDSGRVSDPSALTGADLHAPVHASPAAPRPTRC